MKHFLLTAWSPFCFALCGHYLSPRLAIVFRYYLPGSVINSSLSHSSMFFICSNSCHSSLYISRSPTMWLLLSGVNLAKGGPVGDLVAVFHSCYEYSKYRKEVLWGVITFVLYLWRVQLCLGSSRPRVAGLSTWRLDWFIPWKENYMTTLWMPPESYSPPGTKSFGDNIWSTAFVIVRLTEVMPAILRGCTVMRT